MNVVKQAALRQIVKTALVLRGPCNICYSEDDPRAVCDCCYHCFCEDCLVASMHNNKKCPVCGVDFMKYIREDDYKNMLFDLVVLPRPEFLEKMNIVKHNICPELRDVLDIANSNQDLDVVCTVSLSDLANSLQPREGGHHVRERLPSSPDAADRHQGAWSSTFSEAAGTHQRAS